MSCPQRQPPLYKDQWRSVALGNYGCMEVTVTEARSSKQEGNPDLQQGLAILRSAAVGKGRSGPPCWTLSSPPLQPPEVSVYCSAPRCVPYSRLIVAHL